MLDFGIAGKTAIVCASSKGLGYGCADALAAVGVNLVMNARTESTLAEAAESIRIKHGVSVTEVACDITTDEGRSAVLDAAGNVDILVNNAGGPPPGDFRDWTRETWIKALDANMLTAFELIKAVVDPMCERRFGRIVNITSGSVKSPIPALGLSNGARGADRFLRRPVTPGGAAQRHHQRSASGTVQHRPHRIADHQHRQCGGAVS